MLNKQQQKTWSTKTSCDHFCDRRSQNLANSFLSDDNYCSHSNKNNFKSNKHILIFMDTWNLMSGLNLCCGRTKAASQILIQTLHRYKVFLSYVLLPTATLLTFGGDVWLLWALTASPHTKVMVSRTILLIRVYKDKETKAYNPFSHDEVYDARSKATSVLLSLWIQ